jgi:hypothetical protein
MGFQSQSGHVGVKTQDVKGTYKDPGAADPDAGVFMRIRSGALGGNRDLMIPDPEIGGSRDVPDAQLGPVGFSGSYDFYARMEMIATLLYGALGIKATTGTALTGFTHELTPADVTALPWLSVEEVIAGSYESFKYTDVKVNTLHLESAANGYLMGTVGLVGLTQQLLAVPTPDVDQRWDISGLLVGTNVTVRYNGIQLPAKSWNMDINNNLETDDFRLGSLFLGDAVEKRREVTMGVTIRPNDSALWRQAMWGSPTATQPLGQSFKDDASVTIASLEDIPGATPGTKYAMTFTVPQAIIAPFGLNPSGDDVLQHDLEIRAVRPNNAIDILTATVKNSYADVA